MSRQRSSDGEVCIRDWQATPESVHFVELEIELDLPLQTRRSAVCCGCMMADSELT